MSSDEKQDNLLSLLSKELARSPKIIRHGFVILGLSCLFLFVLYKGFNEVVVDMAMHYLAKVDLTIRIKGLAKAGDQIDFEPINKFAILDDANQAKIPDIPLDLLRNKTLTLKNRNTSPDPVIHRLNLPGSPCIYISIEKQ